MRNLVIMPAMAQNRERMNLGEYAEEATIIMDEPVRPANHFIEANTQEVTIWIYMVLVYWNIYLKG